MPVVNLIYNENHGVNGDMKITEVAITGDVVDYVTVTYLVTCDRNLNHLSNVTRP